jgi:hypothetical protein
LHIAATNLYNIGEFSKALEHLNAIVSIKKDYNVDVHLLRAKASMKLGNNLNEFISAVRII